MEQETDALTNCEIEASYECHTGFTDEPITAGTPWAAQIVWDNKADDPIAGEESICYNCGNEVWELGEECDNADGTGDGCTDNCEIEASYECHTGFTDEPITAGTPWAAQIVWDNKADDPIAGEESIWLQLWKRGMGVGRRMW
jgi:cysteine-rich repeat protein